MQQENLIRMPNDDYKDLKVAPKGNLYQNSTTSIKKLTNPKKNLQKHEIEVMVLSKVDPLNSAFPAGAEESEAAAVKPPLPQIGTKTQAVYH